MSSDNRPDSGEREPTAREVADEVNATLQRISERLRGWSRSIEEGVERIDALADRPSSTASEERVKMWDGVDYDAFLERVGTKLDAAPTEREEIEGAVYYGVHEGIMRARIAAQQVLSGEDARTVDQAIVEAAGEDEITDTVCRRIAQSLRTTRTEQPTDDGRTEDA